MQWLVNMQVWRPTDDHKSLKEGAVYEITNLNTSGTSDSGILEMSTQTQTRWQYVAQHDSLQDKLLVNWVPRKTINLLALHQIPSGTSFDYQGCVVLVGNPSSSSGWNFQQWVFLVDETVSSKMDMLLAVKLCGPRESIDFLDPTAWCDCICTFRDICYEGMDTENHLLVASASEISRHDRELHNVHNSESTRVRAWMEGCPELLVSIRARIEELVNLK